MKIRLIILGLLLSVLGYGQIIGIIGSSEGGVVDATPPAFSSAELGTYNDSIVLVLMDEAMNEDSIAPTTAFNFTGSVTSIGINAISINDDSLFITLDSSLTVYVDSTFLVDYTPGWPRLQDAAENTSVAWVDSTVTNNLTTPSFDGGIITDGDFPDNTNWTEGTGWSITGGAATLTDAATLGELEQASGDMETPLAASTTYDYSFDLDITSGTTASFSFRNGDGENFEEFTETTDGTKTGTFTLAAWITEFSFHIVASVGGDADYSIDNLTVEVQ